MIENYIDKLKSFYNDEDDDLQVYNDEYKREEKNDPDDSGKAAIIWGDREV